MNDLNTAAAHYEAALKEAFPRGATGDVFHHWNEARKALEQPAQQESEAVRAAWMAGYTEGEREALEQPAQQEPEFFTHCVDKPYDWSEWVCPDPKSYLMKCCDCGLVHEAEFGVVRYESETELEYCDTVDDPNLQAVFRMRRSEQWSPVDMAHRTGGLPMEQPAQQEPVAKVYRHGRSSAGEPWHGVHWFDEGVNMPDGTLLYTRPAREPEQQEPFGHGGRPMTLRECMEAEEPSQAEPVECMCGICKLGKREPLSENETVKLQQDFAEANRVSTVEGAFYNGVRAAEAAHGITGEKK